RSNNATISNSDTDCRAFLRQVGQNKMYFLVALLERLPSSYEMIVKLHPNEGHLRELYQNLHPRVHCFFNEMVDIQELYLIS
ncbi:hypothetical protein DD873_09195, partial [Staphylococcus pseudintermedius]|uniref:hypothetical protein n=1 Tax=Staphylococcus pseudintermedius TaxID=283734 RepID=UPI000DA04A5C